MWLNEKKQSGNRSAQKLHVKYYFYEMILIERSQLFFWESLMGICPIIHKDGFRFWDKYHEYHPQKCFHLKKGAGGGETESLCSCVIKHWSEKEKNTLNAVLRCPPSLSDISPVWNLSNMLTEYVSIIMYLGCSYAHLMFSKKSLLILKSQILSLST